MSKWVLASGETDEGVPCWAATNGGDLYVLFSCATNPDRADFYARQYVAIMHGMPLPPCAACTHPAHYGVCPIPECPGHTAGIACQGIIEHWERYP